MFPSTKFVTLNYNTFFFFFDNLGRPGQRSEDTRTLTNPKGTRNTLLGGVP
jgi:hypothetical protein